MNTQTFFDLDDQFKRIAVVGPPLSGKTTLAQKTRKKVLHGDDFMHLPWSMQSSEIVKRCQHLDEFLIEGVQVARGLRKGLDVDAILVLRQKAKLEPKQLSMKKAINTIMSEVKHPNIYDEVSTGQFKKR